MHHFKSILITGASSGIGEALALHYAQPGITLFLSGRNEQRLSDVAAECEAAGACVFIKTIDVGNRDDMALWISESDAIETLDLVVANAGISGGTSGGVEPADQTRQIFEINLGGVLNTVLPSLDLMANRGRGQIAIISSLAGFLALPGAPAYGVSKAAVLQYGEALRPSAAKRGVGVSVVCPGFVHSRMTAANPFRMPLVMAADKAARIIADGLSCNRARIAFPLPMYFGIWMMAHLCPPALLRWLLSRLPEKPITPDRTDNP